MDAIFLIGFMGAGKTTVSKELAIKLEMPQFDTDSEIVAMAGKSINELFAKDGEAYFRQLETEALEKMPEENAVIATGGGIILSEKNRQLLKEKGKIVFLYASIEEIHFRLKGDTTRPLIQNQLDRATVLYQSRMKLYQEVADFQIDTTGKPAGKIAEEILERMNQ